MRIYFRFSFPFSLVAQTSFPDLTQGLVIDSLRVEPLGRGQLRALYWYFCPGECTRRDPAQEGPMESPLSEQVPSWRSCCRRHGHCAQCLQIPLRSLAFLMEE